MPSSPAKQPRTRKSPVADPQQQLSLLFNEAPETAPAPTPAPAAVPVELATAQPAIAITSDGEALALQLEQHPDYRVLRRLVPQLHFAAASGPGVKRLLVLDTETTGLEHSRDKIIELALLRVDIDTATGLPCGSVQVYDGLEDPGQPIPDIARKITGIDDSMVAGQALDEARITELLEGVDLVVAHNAGFDRPFVEARLPAFAAKAWACSFADIDWKQEGRDSAKLTALALDLGRFYDAHRAEMDCHALLAVLQAPMPIAGHTGLAHLLAAAEGTRYRLQANGAPFDAKDALKERGYRWDAANKVWHTRLMDEAALQGECDWLAAAVYRGRAARVQVEALDARVRYASRAGLLTWRNIG
ncbi:3'-5' exonuclease [Rhodoferax sp. WC2427]|uniref:3'-5' exonuclease n=1 Tax=Rhodoferax sp. WC2427 TaxID=3234144 RepID=UPI003466E35D